MILQAGFTGLSALKIWLGRDSQLETHPQFSPPMLNLYTEVAETVIEDRNSLKDYKCVNMVVSQNRGNPIVLISQTL